jgi:hypothetical protein
MSELKPCPCCAGDARYQFLPSKGHWIVCDECLLSTGRYATKALAAKNWNRRPSPWIRFEDRKPEEGQGILVRVKRIGKTYLINYSSELFKEHDCFWMPIPPLEENNA